MDGVYGLSSSSVEQKVVKSGVVSSGVVEFSASFSAGGPDGDS